ncbi:MAG: hypothetical protein ACTSR0_02845 [Candidatus Asgardarchaeia archaeon]
MAEKQFHIREVKGLCEELRKIKGVENIILTTRDGHPISISGLWISKRDIFDMCSITAAVNTTISQMVRGYQYTLIEGSYSKLAIFPLSESIEAYMSVMMREDTNLGALILKSKRTIGKILDIIHKIRGALEVPLVEFKDEDISMIVENLNIIRGLEREQHRMKDFYRDLNLSVDAIRKIRKLVEEFKIKIPSVREVYIAGNGGYPIYSSEPYVYDKINFYYSTFDLFSKLVFSLKRDEVESMLIKTKDKYYIFKRLKGSTLVVLSEVDGTKLGLTRILMESLKGAVDRVISESPPSTRPVVFDEDYLESFWRH